jgi:PAS domain S-box-containing protein
MKDKTKEQLATELAELRQRIAELEASETERKRAEEALRASQEYARNIIDSSLNMIISVDMDRRIVEFNRAAQETFGYRPEEVLGKPVDMLYADPREGLRVHETTIKKGQHAQEILDQRKNGQVFPAFLSASVLRDARGELVGVMGVCRDITERKRAEEALRWRNRELALLNQVSRAFTATLDLDQVLVTVLEEVRRLLDVTACSVWLSEPETDELVCRQATGPQSEIVRGWRLAPGEGLAGWVARSGESLIVPDIWADERHFKDVDQRTGLGLRSIVTVPLRVRQDMIGVLQAVDTEVDRFGPTDLELLEPLATSAAIAIENARLYEQAQQDAETKSMLLREVNHRVKNNLTAIIGLLYAERRRARSVEDQSTYQSAMNTLVNRVKGLATVHSLLTASQWAPLLLRELTGRVIRSSLQMLPRDKHVSVEVSPSQVRVTPDQAHKLALVINELSTNTVKHALLERNTARITVRIALEDEDDTVLFEFRDDGPGYPEEVLQLKRQNIGLDLVHSMVREGLRGELSLHNDHGAVAVIQFKSEA